VRDLIAMLSIVFIGLFWCPSYAWYRWPAFWNRSGR
jgi:hypothetical protein